VKHRANVEQLQVRLQTAALTLQRTEQEHPPGVIEEQIVLGLPDQCRDVPHQHSVGDDDPGN
jgi:hypothetical protein